MRISNRRTKRKAKKSYLIIVDGKTEVWYLQLMKQYEELPRIDIEPKLPKKKKLKELFELVSKAKDYDKVIWLLDLDVILRNNQVEKFKKYVNKLKKNSRVIVLVNNPCLEFWYLLHFKETSKLFSKCNDVVTEIKGIESLKDYKKTHEYYIGTDIYLRLKPFQSTAIENAKKLGNLDFGNIKSAKAEIYKIFDILI